jgi:hypothetical protein
MVVSAVLSLNSAQAQVWNFEPIVRVGAEYNDNATLDIRTDEEVTLQGYLVDLEAVIRYSSEATSLLFQPRFRSRDYPDEPDFDSDSYFLRSLYSYNGKSNTIGFRVNWEDRPVRTAERTDSDLDIEDPNELTDNDTERTFITGTRNLWRVAPYWRYQVSDSSSIGADIDYFDVQYDNVFAGLLTDYKDTRVNLNYRNAFSNVTAAMLTATARMYDSAGATGDTTGYGLSAGVERALSEKMTLTAMVGLERTELETITFDPEFVGYITLVRNLETIRMFAQYRRSISASGADSLSVRDSVNINFQRRLSERISAGLGVRAYQSRGLAGTATIDDRNYVQLQANFRWYLTRALIIETDYRYTVSDRSATIGERSNANQINLWFVYQPRTRPRI